MRTLDQFGIHTDLAERWGSGSQPSYAPRFAFSSANSRLTSSSFSSDGQPVLNGVAGQFGLRLAQSFVALHLALHAIERVGIRCVAHRQARVAGFVQRAGAAMLRDQHVALGLRLGQLLLQLAQRRFEVFHLHGLIGHLVRKVRGQDL